MKLNVVKFIIFHAILAVLILWVPSDLLSKGILFTYGFVIVPHYFKNNVATKKVFLVMVSFAIVFGCTVMLIRTDGDLEDIVVYLVAMILQYPLRSMIQNQSNNTSLRK